MDHPTFARDSLAALCGVQGIATLALDLNRTHATNPEWTGHARFHVVWQSVHVAALSIVEIGLIFGPERYRGPGFYLAALLASLSPMAFLMAMLHRKRFGGTLSDPNGIPPLRTKVLGMVRCVDLNVAAVLVALLSVAGLLAIYRW